MVQKIAIIGMGTVGRQLVRILSEERARIQQKYGVEIEVIAIYEIDGALKNGGAPLDLQKIISSKNIRELEYWEKGSRRKVIFQAWIVVLSSTRPQLMLRRENRV